MARPTKHGLDYFPFDVTFFMDIKIKALKGRFGSDGITVYIYLLTEIYRNGYYLEITEDALDAMVGDLGIEFGRLTEILIFMRSRSLFKVFEPENVYTSVGIQRRFQEAVKVRASKNPVKVSEFWLLGKEETQSFIRFTQNEGFSENNSGFSEINDTKESKEKESREKEMEVKEIKKDYSYSSCSSLEDNIGEIISYLNKVCKKDYRTDSFKTRGLIKTRFVEGFTVEDFKTIIDKKAAEWLGNSIADRFLRPETLFGVRFEKFLHQELTQ